MTLISFLLIYFSGLPLGVLFLKGLLSKTAGISTEFWQQRSIWTSALYTLYLCLATCALTLIIGLPLAWLLSRTDLPRKTLWKTLFSIPYIIPSYIGAMAWIKLLNPTSGNLNLWLMSLFHLDHAPLNIYSLWGTAWVLGLFFYSFVFLSCHAALENIDPSLEEASLLSGASRWQTFQKITLPLISPALLQGLILVTMATAAAFGVPALLAMPKRIFVLTTKIYTLMLGYGDGMDQAITLSILLMITGIVGLGMSHLYLRKSRYTTVSGKYSHRSALPLKKLKGVTLGGLSIFWILCIGLPLATVILSSFLKIYGDPISFSNLSLQKYTYVLWTLPNTQKAFLNSFYFALLAASFALFLGLPLSYIKVRTSFKFRYGLDFLATLPFITPCSVLAIALIIFFSGLGGLNLYNTAWMLLVAYTIKYLSFATQNISSALQQISPSLEEAASLSGAKPLKVFQTILIPLLKPVLIASFFLVFIPTFGELTMSILLVGPSTETLGTLLYNLQSYDDPQSAAVLATLMVAVILTANFMVKVATQGKYGV
ncbi:MAG: iron ABC transporter permease [Deltaproteobacteria bacterium]|nr:iron ABC transporter permease [Deltaproteobacteria bacterium]